ncbi:MAG TPA: ABC transporter permease [Candidatus Limnocylindrales bacterium]|nr:ABC transporter permease [Candidatus Limnocylindrales bacterium]
MSVRVGTAADSGLLPAPAASPKWLGVRVFLRRRTAVIGVVLVILNILVAVTAPVLARWDPQLLDVKARLSPPSGAHWFGTDDVGRDAWSRVIYGARLSMLVGASVVVLSFVGGLFFGLLGGSYRALDNVLMRVMDGLMAFPGIILAIALMAALGPSVMNVILALGIVYVPRVARIVRGSVLVIRETPYVEAARALGIPDTRILLLHILPNCLSPVIVQGTFIFAAAVLGEAALSFLGVGVPPQIPSWGNVLAEGRLYIQQAAWLTLFPGAAIMLSILGLNLFGDGLRDLLDPKLRGVQGAARES